MKRELVSMYTKPRGEGVCKMHVKGRQASSNYLGCSLSEAKDVEHMLNCEKTDAYQHIILCREWLYHIQVIILGNNYTTQNPH